MRNTIEYVAPASVLRDPVVAHAGDNLGGEAELRSNPLIGAVGRLEHCRAQTFSKSSEKSPIKVKMYHGKSE